MCVDALTLTALIYIYRSIKIIYDYECSLPECDVQALLFIFFFPFFSRRQTADVFSRK